MLSGLVFTGCTTSRLFSSCAHPLQGAQPLRRLLAFFLYLYNPFFILQAQGNTQEVTCALEILSFSWFLPDFFPPWLASNDILTRTN